MGSGYMYRYTHAAFPTYTIQHHSILLNISGVCGCIGRPVNAVVSASFKSFPLCVMNIRTIVHVDGDRIFMLCTTLLSFPSPPPSNLCFDFCNLRV